MSIKLSIIIFFTPLLIGLFSCWLVDDALTEYLANKKQVIIAGILALLNVLHLVIAGPYVYKSQWGFYTLIPGLGLLFTVLPGVGNVFNIKAVPLPYWLRCILGVLFLTVPLILWWLTEGFS